MAAAFICRRYVLNDDELASTFDLLDMDKDGRLSRVEIATLMRIMKVEPTRKELDFIFEEMDHDKCGKIDKEAFVSYLRSPPINRITIGELHEKFNELDSNGDGTITQEQLRAILENTADLHDEDAIEQMFLETDTDGDGRITFEEFIRMIRGD